MEEGSQITIPVGATKIDLELIKVYAWREVSDESASDYFVFLYHGDVGYLKRESIKDKTHITLLCGRE